LNTHGTQTLEIIGACEVSYLRPKLDKPLGRPRPRCYDNIKVRVKEIGCEGRIVHVWLKFGCSGKRSETR
jgi:hypothetical protein